MEEMLEELMLWLRKCEDTLTQLEAEPLPDDMSEILVLIKVEYRLFTTVQIPNLFMTFVNFYNPYYKQIGAQRIHGRNGFPTARD